MFAIAWGRNIRKNGVLFPMRTTTNHLATQTKLTLEPFFPSQIEIDKAIVSPMPVSTTTTTKNDGPLKET